MQIDEVSLYQMILLLAVRYGPMGHAAEWPFYLKARDTLREIEGMPGREGQDGLWIPGGG